MSRHMTALELLKLGDECRQKPFLNLYWPELLGVTFGTATGIFMNFSLRRPLFSGIQKHVLCVAGWTAFLTFLQKTRNDYLAEKDAVLVHYVELHPEDFPSPERKKLGEIFEPWVPVR